MPYPTDNHNLALHVTGSGADPSDVLCQVVTDLPGIAQTGDSYGRIGANGAALTALGDTRLANLDATVSSRLAASSYSAPPSTSAIWSNVTRTLTSTHALSDDEKDSIAIECAAAVVASSVVITPISPITATEGEPLNVLRPDEYSSTTGQPIAFTASGVPEPDEVFLDVSVSGTNKLHITCDASYSGSDLTITVPALTADELADLPQGAIADFRFYGTYSGAPERTYRRGKVFVEDTASAPALSTP